MIVASRSASGAEKAACATPNRIKTAILLRFFM